MQTRELEAAIARAGKSKKEIAELLGISNTALYNKINGISEFKGSQIMILATALSLNAEAVNGIFFTA